VSNKAHLDYGSWISLKNSDWANGKIRFNLLLYDIKPMAVFFRYKDQQNHYGVEFSANGLENVKFYKTIDGNKRQIATKTVKMLTGKWYRVTLILDYDRIKVQLQSHKIRHHKTLFHREIKDGPSRGSLAFASNGNNKFYISGISIDEYKPDRKGKFKNNKRSWTGLLKHLKQKQRKIYCFGLFNLMQEEMPRCMEIHNYCRIRCDKLVPVSENILNYSCQRDCVRTSNILENKSGELKLSKGTGWVPKKGDKCDYLPKGEKVYRMCLVKGVEKRGAKTNVNIEYLIDGSATSKAEVKFPSKSLKKCGEALSARNDCKLN